MMRRILKAIAVLAGAAAVFGQARRAPAQNEEWTRPFPPFKMIGNIY